jgi:Acetyltransferases
MAVEYTKIDDLIFNKIVNEYGDWVKEYVQIKSDTFTLAAMDGDIPAGFICVNSQTLKYPLEHLKEAYIDDLEVHESYRRQGIGQHLITCAEEWAKESGFKQIRTHSSNQAVEAIHMWYKLNYGLSPHDYYDDEPKKDDGRGYWVVKILS